jgi:hypothetical protein
MESREKQSVFMCCMWEMEKNKENKILRLKKRDRE